MIRYLFILLSAISISNSQSKCFRRLEDPAGDIAAEREGYMTGNRFFFISEITLSSDWPKSNVSRWPNNLNGVKMVDGIGLLIGAKVYIKDDKTTLIDSTVVTDTNVIALGEDLHELYYLQTSYREEMDINPSGTFEYGLYLLKLFQ